MIEPMPLSFGSDWCEVALDGVPAVERVLRAFVGRCQACDADAEEQTEGTILVNLVEVDGTLYGDSFCTDCIDLDEVDGPSFGLPPLPQTLDVGDA